MYDESLQTSASFGSWEAETGQTRPVHRPPDAPSGAFRVLRSRLSDGRLSPGPEPSGKGWPMTTDVLKHAIALVGPFRPLRRDPWRMARRRRPGKGIGPRSQMYRQAEGNAFIPNIGGSPVEMNRCSRAVWLSCLLGFRTAMRIGSVWLGAAVVLMSVPAFLAPPAWGQEDDFRPRHHEPPVVRGDSPEGGTCAANESGPIKWFHRPAACSPCSAAMLVAGVSGQAEYERGRRRVFGSATGGSAADAFRRLRRVAGGGDPHAAYVVAVALWNGIGTPQDRSQAVQWYQQSSRARDADAEVDLGEIYVSGAAVQRDPAEAFVLFQKAAEQGSARGKYDLGVLYVTQEGAPHDEATALRLYEAAANEGLAIAEYHMGIVLEHKADRDFPSMGKSASDQDYLEAVDWYSKAAAQCDAAAADALGLYYRKGRGVPQNYASAVEWYLRAADQGMLEGLDEAGDTYFYAAEAAKWGQDTPGFSSPPATLYAQAVACWRKAAAQGDAEAQYAVGGAYMRGQGVPQNDVEALSWYLKAAYQGVGSAENYVGLYYWHGWGASQNLAEAKVWLERAVRDGDPYAANNLNGLQHPVQCPRTWSESGCVYMSPAVGRIVNDYSCFETRFAGCPRPN